ncbi:MAG: MBL fold metallo-hydrolase [Lachnospiraceae bacterium]|nr:MBL fold metallo-hydrolase [Lachnospiraceae bacterium]
MKVTIIGSSNGVPEAHRKCSCVMIEVNGRIYFADMGTSAVDALRNRGIPVESVKGIFITHMHGDHTNGLPQFIDLMTWYFTDADPVICLPVIGAAAVLRDWVKITQNDGNREIQYRETLPGLVYDDGVLKVTAIPTKHCCKSYAYLLEAEGKTVLITGDLQHPSVDFPETAKERELDLVICESAHFPVREYLPVFESCRIRNVCLTHYPPSAFGSVYELQEELREKGIGVRIAADDLEINV